MKQLEKDIKYLKEKYGDMKAIKTAEAIIRLVEYAERKMEEEKQHKPI